MNKVILKGRTAQDLELKYTASGTAVANVSLATNERWKDKDGNKQESTEWHRLVIWSKTAEVMNEHAKKGQEILVEGKLQTRKWEDKEGNNRYTTEIVVNGFEFCGSGSGTTGESKPEENKQENFTPDDVPF